MRDIGVLAYAASVMIRSAKTALTSHNVCQHTYWNYKLWNAHEYATGDARNPIDYLAILKTGLSVTPDFDSSKAVLMSSKS
jgi:hypothetical protein